MSLNLHNVSNTLCNKRGSVSISQVFSSEENESVGMGGIALLKRPLTDGVVR